MSDQWELFSCLEDREGRAGVRGRGCCHKHTQERKHLSVWGMAVGCPEVTLFHFIWRFNYSTRCCPVILAARLLPEARAPGLICRGKRVILCASENIQNQGLCFTFWISLCQHCVPGDPIKPCCMVLSSLGSEHSYPLEDIPLIPPSLLWPSTEASCWWEQRHGSLVAQRAFLAAVTEIRTFHPAQFVCTAVACVQIGIHRYSSVSRWLDHSCQPALLLFLCRICLG